MVTKICISGGGLAGLACALSLAKAAANHGYENRIHITLIELRNFQSKGATFSLAPSGQKAMEEFCPELLEELIESGILIPSTGGYMLPWYRVRDGLLAKVLDLPSDIITILENTHITSIIQNEDSVYSSPVIVEALQTTSITTATEEKKENGDEDYDTTNNDSTVVTDTKNISLQADIVIGADGLHSVVRKFIPKAKAPISSGKIVWRGTVDEKVTSLSTEMSSLLTDVSIFKLDLSETHTSTMFNFHTKIPGTLCWVITSTCHTDKSALECLKSITDETTRNEFRCLLEASSKEELEYKTDLCTVPLDSNQWPGKGRLTLIGDAAHAVRPASGLGGSLAFEDVVVLTRQLAAVLFSEQEEVGKYSKSEKGVTDSNTEDPVVRALREFETLRLPRCKAIQDDQDRIAESGYSGADAYKKFEWTPEYKEWVFKGPDASPHPPANIYVGQDQ